jgi:ankyrin repeat protein
LFRVAFLLHSELFEGDEETVRDPPSLEVVKYLALASPQSLPLEDMDEKSALEYAILSSADIEVVNFLMRLTRVQVSSGKPSSSSFLFGMENDALFPNRKCPPTEPNDTRNTIHDSLLMVVENVPVNFGITQVAQDLVSR